MPYRLCSKIFIVMALTMQSVAAQDTFSLDREMEQAIEQVVSRQVPGISVAIAGKSGLLWSGTAGYSDIEQEQPVSPSHLFGIGDLSGHYIAALIQQLAEEGYLNMEQTASDILGDVVANIENADIATVSQLLNHTSGIYSWADDADWKRRARGIQLNPTYRWEKGEQLKYITKDRHGATSPAGDVYKHSKSNDTILALIAEEVTGGWFEEEIKTRILVPNNLRNTYYQTYEPLSVSRQVGSYHLGTDKFITNVGINAKFDFEKDRLIKTSGTSLSSEGLASGIVSTPRDLALFAAASWKRNGTMVQVSHSEILGYTADIRKIEGSDIIVVSLVNLGVSDTGENETVTFLREYVDRLLLPIAKKYPNSK